MEQKSTRLPFIRLGCIFVAFVHVANGAMVCFQKQSTSGSHCHSILNYNLSSPANCCAKYPNAYYVITRAAYSRLLFLGAKNCVPCTAPTNVTATTAPPTVPQCNKTCIKGKKCMLKPNGKARCVCASGDCCQHSHRTSRSPVCASDGCTYRSECEFRRARREGKPYLEVTYRGVCQTGCANVVCRKNRTCIVDQYERAFCVDCNYHCSSHSMSSGKLCGADGVTYNNRCDLRKEACNRGKSIAVAYMGQCHANRKCDKVDCGKPKKVCVEDHAGRPRCVTCECEGITQSKCPGGPSPTTICGTDHKTYKDFCSLREQMCRIKKFIDVKHVGYCKGDKPRAPPPKDEGPRPTPSSSSLLAPFQSEDVGKYYISLRNFVDILKNSYPLNITAPKYKNLKPREKFVLLSELLKQLKQKWRKIKIFP